MTALYGLQPSYFGVPDNRIFMGGAVNSMPNPQPGGPDLHICDLWRQGDPAIPTGTGCPFVSFYDTYDLHWENYWKLGIY
jgi:hypothetical protein